MMEQFDTLPIQYRHIEHMHEGVWLKFFLGQNDRYENLDNFPLYGFCICIDWADQFLPQHLREQFDMLPVQ